MKYKINQREIAKLRFLILPIFALILGGCASIPITPLSKNDIPELVGKWKGDFYCVAHSNFQISELKILNENLEGEITFDTNSREKTTHSFAGQIKDEKLVIGWEKDRWVKLALYKGNGKIKLKGNFEWRDHRGTLAFHKIE